LNLIDNDVAKGSNLILAKVAANLLGVETGPRIASRKDFFLRRSARTKQGSHFIDQGRIGDRPSNYVKRGRSSSVEQLDFKIIQEIL
jgi:hypothetical protein